MTQHVDVLICGSGSAGICAATWLARYGLRCKILESHGYEVKGVQVDSKAAADLESYPVTVVALKDGVEETFKAKYALVSIA
ncbi:hypothetical protein V501_01467 [Pseudogymnoascus sp. VKM F-4519 (FW-2642)]|jgi:2-polyprenyl-6-methoxyphenol hydroxylase-like FAD-dependent oxidoreductase|nr:hypothetical protein V501_01467 [Pseudogymnoascus sp. VKM F-4519 (FW-2642)]